MSFNFTGLQNKERRKGHPALLRENRNKLGINTQIIDYKTCDRSQHCDVRDYDVLADGTATLWMGIVSVSDGLKRGNKPIPGLTAATRLFNR